jgi:hypothetical protein
MDANQAHTTDHRAEGHRSMNNAGGTRTPPEGRPVDGAGTLADHPAVTVVKAAELQVGDYLLINDWQLHVRSVDVDGSSVAFVVDEFPEIIHHRPGDHVLHVRRGTAWRLAS